MTPVGMLRTEKLCKSFGGTVAVDSVDLNVRAASLHAIIGPNGAGKTTLFNLLAGEMRPTSGGVFFEDREITRLDVRERSHLGIGRSFQRTNIFRALSAYENVRVAAQSRTQASFAMWEPATRLRDVAARAQAILDDAGLAALAVRTAGELAGGDQRLLEIAIALATAPKLLLLDEPSQGLSGEDALRLMARIRTLAERYTIVLIEHNMNLVMELSDEITVMNFGSILARGTPAEIRADPQVREAYLGSRG
ncbi:MAG: ABC transporter ATP-binding protein [Candidatus Eremiobacteraeota bacterium]|nr:ABC transporter ATP-binding protein [Candidatus Eremiobacteraeota bacterium]